ncbi:unnamed protein product (plasmid) [Mycetohabitans rhizoxinica HKI 454]|uniref:Uncharacterized protein n=1 Tax=Mycetohabitans rhizoxinica (strain DSM 19002 / CIP 109453 / HKI 454) TaxID=882378 RepID=E5AUK7_MYCRK|nr:unnamed protein product [Mycetohabitans rhizoxinica HKI 454]
MPAVDNPAKLDLSPISFPLSPRLIKCPLIYRSTLRGRYMPPMACFLGKGRVVRMCSRGCRQGRWSRRERSACPACRPSSAVAMIKRPACLRAYTRLTCLTCQWACLSAGRSCWALW